jgi:hypothetical protein
MIFFAGMNMSGKQIICIRQEANLLISLTLPVERFYCQFNLQIEIVTDTEIVTDPQAGP